MMNVIIVLLSFLLAFFVWMAILEDETRDESCDNNDLDESADLNNGS